MDQHSEFAREVLPGVQNHPEIFLVGCAKVNNSGNFHYCVEFSFERRHAFGWGFTLKDASSSGNDTNSYHCSSPCYYTNNFLDYSCTSSTIKSSRWERIKLVEKTTSRGRRAIVEIEESPHRKERNQGGTCRRSHPLKTTSSTKTTEWRWTEVEVQRQNGSTILGVISLICKIWQILQVRSSLWSVV